MFRIAATILALTACLAAGRAAAAESSTQLQEDVKKLQGVWALRSYTVDGVENRGADAGTTFTVTASRWKASWRLDEGGHSTEEGTIRIVGAEAPRVLELVHDGGAHKGGVTRAFYEVGEDYFTYVQVHFMCAVPTPTVVKYEYARPVDPDVLALDKHEGSAGPPQWNRNFTYTLKASDKVRVNRTLVRCRVNTTTARNTYGEVMLQVGDGEWTYLDEWTPRRLDVAKRHGDWLTLDLQSLPTAVNSDSIRIRFEYKAGVSLECYEVQWVRRGEKG